MSPFRIALVSASVVLCFLVGAVAPFSAGGAAPPVRRIEPEKKPLPPGAIARLGSLRLRHEEAVRSIVFSPDGKKIASVSQDGPAIRVWEARTGKLLHEIDAPGIFSRDFFGSEDYTLAFTPDGKSVAAGVGADVCFWELQSGREVRRFRGNNGKGVLALTFSRDKKTFYCGLSDNRLYQWDIATGKLLRSWDYFAGKQSRIYANGFAENAAVLKAISPDGKTAVWHVRHWANEGSSVSVDGWQFVIWDVFTGKDRCPLTAKNDRDFFDANVVFSADGKHLTAYTGNSPMIVWDAATGKKLKTLSGGSVEAVAYSPGSRRVAAITRWTGLSLCVWDLATGKELWHHQISWWGAPGWHKALAFAPGGKTVALAHWKNVRLWDVESAKEVPSLEGHRWPVHTLEFSPKDRTLISADDACVCEWGMAPRRMSRHPLIVYHGAGQSSAESYETKLRIYQPEGRPPQLRELLSDKLLGEFTDIKGAYRHGCFSSDGRTAALIRSDKQHDIIFLDVPSRKVRSSLTTAAPIGGNLVLSGDGKILAATCSDQTVVLIDSFRGKIVRRLGTPHSPPGEEDPRINLTAGTFSPDGQLLAFGTRMDRPGDRWRWNFGSLLGLPPDTPGIRVWHVATGRELRQFENCLKNAPHGGITSLRFSYDSKSLAVALYFNPWRPGDPEQAAVPVLEVASGRSRRRFKGHTAQVASVAFFPDGKALATGSKDSTILLWDMKRIEGTEPAVNTPVARRLHRHWNNLAEEDAASAYDAILALADMPEQCVPFLAKRLRPVESVSHERLVTLIAGLDNNSFVVRDEMSAKLMALHELAGPALKKALNGKVSLEARRRIRAIVERIDAVNYSPTLIRELRSVEVLERIGTKEARHLLERLAAGAAEAFLTLEAKASLARLRQAS